MKHFMTLIALVVAVTAGAQDYPQQVTHFPGDLNNDSIVGTQDLLELLPLFGVDYSDIIGQFPCGGMSEIAYDGYNYDLVVIGNQCWFAENLRTEHYANGDAISSNLPDSQWDSWAGGAQAVYGEGSSNCFGSACDEVENLLTYGRLYNWYAVNDSRGLCPDGWHIPTDAEWITLEIELGMSSSEANTTGFRGTDQGAQLMSSPLDSPSANGTNTSGFSALPGGGSRSLSGSFIQGTECAGYHTASLYVSSYGVHPYARSFCYYSNGVNRYYNYFNVMARQSGKYVRCLEDE